MKQSIRKLMTLLLFTCSIGAWADDTQDDGGLALEHSFGDRATVTFYDYIDGNGGMPTEETVQSLKNKTGITNIGDCQYIVAHIVPAAGYWTNAAILYASLLANESIAQSQLSSVNPQNINPLTRGAGIDGRIVVTLIQLDEGRNDGAGWYYYKFPEESSEVDISTTPPTPLYESLLLDGYVLPKFDLSTATASSDGKTYTLTVENKWTTTLTIDEGKTQFEYNGSAQGQGPTKLTNTNIVVKNGDSEAVTFTTVSDHVTGVLGAAEGSNLTSSNKAVDAGSYALTLKAAETTTGTASVATGIFVNNKAVSFTITPKTLTVTAKDKTIKYGDAAANDGVTYEGFVNNETSSNLSGTLEYSYNSQADGQGTSYKTTSPVGIYYIIPKGLEPGNYAFTYIAGKLTVNKNPIDIGDDDNAPAKIVINPVEFTYNGTDQKPTVKVVMKADNKEISANEYSVKYMKGEADVTETKDAATYTVVITNKEGSNYTFSGKTSADYQIKPAPLTVTADGKTKVFGAADPEFTYQVRGLVGDDKLSGELTRGEGENVGEYPIMQGTLACGDNYAITTFTGANLAITPKTVKDDPDTENGESAITIELNPTEYTYDKTEKKPAVTVKDGTTTIASSEYAVAYTNNIDAGTATVTITDKEGGNYTISGTKTFTIKPAALTITADAQTKVAGAEDPTLTYKTEGLVEGDALEGALTRATGEDVGEYAITQGTLKASDNYTVTFTPAKLTITSADFVEGDVTATGYSGTYDGKAHTITVTAPKSATVKYGKTQGTYDLQAAPTYTNAGNYTVYFQVTMDNTNPVVGSQTVTISKKDLTITADDKTKVKGEDDPALTYKTEGLVEGDALEGALTRVAGEDAGSYDIQQGSLKATDNYNVTYKGAKLTITAEPTPPAEDTYKVTVMPSTGGEVISTLTENIEAGTQVNLVITADKGYHLTGLSVAKKSGGSVQTGVTIDADGNVFNFFLMPADDAIVTATFEEDTPDQNIFIYMTKYGEVISNVLHADPGQQVNLKAIPEENCELEDLFVINDKGERLQIFTVEDPTEGTIHYFYMSGDKVQVFSSFKGTNDVVDESNPVEPDNLLYLLNSAYASFITTNGGASGVQMAMSLIANIFGKFTPEGVLSIRQGEDMNMAILNLESGWQIKFNFTGNGAMRVLNPQMLKGVGFDENGIISTDVLYEVVADGRLDILLNTSKMALLIQSITIIAPETEPEDPTAINRLETDDEAADTYDLSGRKVDTTIRLPKGVYIRNGRKIVIK